MPSGFSSGTSVVGFLAWMLEVLAVAEAAMSMYTMTPKSTIATQIAMIMIVRNVTIPRFFIVPSLRQQTLPRSISTQR